MPAAEDIRANLQRFAARWSVYTGSERSEAQTFLNELFDCYGSERREVAQFEASQEGRFLDLIWEGVCLFEMKRPSEAKNLKRHRRQALDYWRNAADAERGIPAPRFVVICAFSRLEIWEPGQFPKTPRVELDLIELPDRADTLLFLAGDEPVFHGGGLAVTREAASRVTDLYQHLLDERPSELDELREFILQCVWCMFAEDIGLLPKHLFTQLVDAAMKDKRRSSADELGRLFNLLSKPGRRPEHGLYAGAPYVNGGLFESPAQVHLNHEELMLLRVASEFDWKHVEPSIFGSLLEGGLGHDKQWALGAHYTHEADIQKVIQPTVVEPWRERIGNVTKHREAAQLQADLMDYVVLDPACGSGNFLYVAYRELRRLEQQLAEREQELRRAEGKRRADQSAFNLFFPISNLRGIEIDGFAVRLARVTLWMGHKLAVEELDIDESTLPLADLSGIQAGDALRMTWPRADAIVGNPPFHGDRNLRGIVGDDYIEWLKREFGVGVKDYCVYWFRKAHDHLEPGGRAGLVGTNSISQNRARSASLEYVVDNGGTITNAVSKQPWPGDAVVNVSIVNWLRGESAAAAILDGAEVKGISGSLRGASVGRAAALTQNAGQCFYGPIPGGKGFVLDPDEARELLARRDADYRAVVRPYLVGRDIAHEPSQSPTRYIIDFALRSLEEAMKYPAALAIVRERVKPGRDETRRKAYRDRWWRFSEPIPAMREALKPLSRYIAGTATGKRVFFCWCEPWTCPSNATNVFAFEQDSEMGILLSSAHRHWAWHQASTLRTDIRYTKSSVFETFPWPSWGDPDKEAVAAAASDLVAIRTDLCREQAVGLTNLYNAVDEGAHRRLVRAHEELDSTVAAAYGWPDQAADDPEESVRRLLDLNEKIAAGDLDYAPFG